MRVWPSSSNYLNIVHAKRAEREKALSQAPLFVEDVHGVYLTATASEIVLRIQNGEWTASEVLEAYIARAALSAKLTNCVTEVLFEQARAQAKELDREFASSKRVRGPLHGVPISLKDQFAVNGIDATLGFTQWANNPSTYDASLVTQMYAAGGIPIVKTNVPQTMLAFECSNPLWGRTTNPWNDKYTCGGSSGGEGAILAMDGSALGMGSDIGGSVRIPAAYCGIYAFKPTAGRVSAHGCIGPTPGFETITTVVGPMGRSVGDVELFCRVTFGVQDINEDPAPLPYRDVQLPAKLKFGYYTSDGIVKASPACKRAVLETVEALQKDGHECVEFEPTLAPAAFKVFAAFVSADGYKTLLSHLGPDPQENSLFLVTLGPKLPGIIRAFASWVVETFVGDKMFAEALRESKSKSFHEIMQCTVKRDELVQLWYKEVWERYKIDGIIAPVQALPALPHGGCAFLSPLACATTLFNIIDSPVGCIPVTRVDPKKDQVTEEWKTGPGLGSSLLEDRVYRGKNPVYDPEAMKGMPVGVQVVGKRWEDEKLISMMHVVDKALGQRGFGPKSTRHNTCS